MRGTLMDAARGDRGAADKLGRLCVEDPLTLRCAAAQRLCPAQAPRRARGASSACHFGLVTPATL